MVNAASGLSRKATADTGLFNSFLSAMDEIVTSVHTLFFGSVCCDTSVLADESNPYRKVVPLKKPVCKTAPKSGDDFQKKVVDAINREKRSAALTDALREQSFEQVHKLLHLAVPIPAANTKLFFAFMRNLDAKQVGSILETKSFAALLEKDANLTFHKLMAYAKDPQVRQVLLNFPQFDPNCFDSRGESLLHNAVSRRALERLHELLACQRIDHGAKHCNLPWSTTCVEFAVESGFIEGLRLMLTARQVDQACKNSCLLLAAEQCEGQMVELLLENGVEVNARGANGDTPLHRVTVDRNYNFRCWSDARLKLAKLLLSKGADPNILNSKKQSPLFIPVQNHWTEYVKLLLEHKANPNFPNYNGVVVLRYTLDKSPRSLDLAEALIKHGASVKLAKKSATNWEKEMQDTHPATRAFLEQKLLSK